jgi:hypothetical protein
MYPEFQYRRPPPSYAASMQAYQAQLAAETQSNNNVPPVANNDNYSLPGSPPPSYRSRASTIHSGVHITFPPAHDSAPNSRPPTYRSRAESRARPRLPMEDAEPSSPSGAPPDVSFNGPIMTAETVQQIIGTHRNHQRQQSAGASIWHTRTSSLDLNHAPEYMGHRRGASLDPNSVSVVLGSNTQENQATAAPVAPKEITLSVPGTPSKRRAPPPPSSSVQPSATPQHSGASAKPKTDQASSEARPTQTSVTVTRTQKQAAAVSPTAEDADSWRTRDRDVDTDSTQTHTVSIATLETDGEPEQYNTAL